ncbi:MAG: hypothetical protein ABI321_01270 [Polyangia bacterium]
MRKLVLSLFALLALPALALADPVMVLELHNPSIHGGTQAGVVVREGAGSVQYRAPGPGLVKSVERPPVTRQQVNEANLRQTWKQTARFGAARRR